MDYEAFRTKGEAEHFIREFVRGWEGAKPIQIHWPDSKKANRNGNVWVVQVKGGKTIREDGMVR